MTYEEDRAEELDEMARIAVFHAEIAGLYYHALVDAGVPATDAVTMSVQFLPILMLMAVTKKDD